ncbi:MAG TPA: hypothetical protein EYP14_19230, partial [Planctomycetaceae bacterium]|nr:hypothetical protein [Planctomycetaceae bacterium]
MAEQGPFQRICRLALRLRDLWPAVSEGYVDAVRQHALIVDSFHTADSDELRALSLQTAHGTKRRVEIATTECERLNAQWFDLCDLVNRHLPQVAPDCWPVNCHVAMARGEHIDWETIRAELMRIWRAAAVAHVEEAHRLSHQPAIDTHEKRPKRGTVPGEAKAKIIAGLCEHHQFDGQSVLNTEPISLAKFAKRYGVAKSSVSRFLVKNFGSYAAYAGRCCTDVKTLAMALQMIRGELIPKILWQPLDGGR